MKVKDLFESEQLTPEQLGKFINDHSIDRHIYDRFIMRTKSRINMRDLHPDMEDVEKDKVKIQVFKLRGKKGFNGADYVGWFTIDDGKVVISDRNGHDIDAFEYNEDFLYSAGMDIYDHVISTFRSILNMNEAVAEYEHFDMLVKYLKMLSMDPEMSISSLHPDLGGQEVNLTFTQAQPNVPPLNHSLLGKGHLRLYTSHHWVKAELDVYDHEGVAQLGTTAKMKWGQSPNVRDLGIRISTWARMVAMEALK